MSVLEIIVPTGEIITRAMDDEELEQRAKQEIEIAEREQNKIEMATKKQAAEAKLVALGLTADDLKALGLG